MNQEVTVYVVASKFNYQEIVFAFKSMPRFETILLVRSATDSCFIVLRMTQISNSSALSPNAHRWRHREPCTSATHVERATPAGPPTSKSPVYASMATRAPVDDSREWHGPVRDHVVIRHHVITDDRREYISSPGDDVNTCVGAVTDRFRRLANNARYRRRFLRGDEAIHPPLSFCSYIGCYKRVIFNGPLRRKV